MNLSGKCLSCASKCGAKCLALEEPAWGQPNCAFYIDKLALGDKQYRRDVRLASLTAAQQQYIAYIYYGGEKPWLNDR